MAGNDVGDTDSNLILLASHAMAAGSSCNLCWRQRKAVDLKGIGQIHGQQVYLPVSNDGDPNACHLLKTKSKKILLVLCPAYQLSEGYPVKTQWTFGPTKQGSSCVQVKWIAPSG